MQSTMERSVSAAAPNRCARPEAAASAASSASIRRTTAASSGNSWLNGCGRKMTVRPRSSSARTICSPCGSE